jgi:hypothetical protein
MQHYILEKGILKHITAKMSQFTVLQHDYHYVHASRHNEMFVIYPSATHSVSLDIKYILIQFDWESNSEQANSILAHICSL